MGGRVIFELLACKPPLPSLISNGTSHAGKFVRLNINDGIIALPDCADGPGSSCPLAEFAERTKRRGEEVGGFKELCRLEGDAVEGITFLHQ